MVLDIQRKVTVVAFHTFAFSFIFFVFIVFIFCYQSEFISHSLEMSD